MIQPHRARRAGQTVAVLTLLVASSDAAAQATPLPEGISIGAWTFRPSVELRVRGDYRHFPFDTGGLLFADTAVLGDAAGSNLPAPIQLYPPQRNAWRVAERTRLGIAVDRAPVTGVFVLQDQRPLGGDARVAILGGSLFPGLGPFEGYIDVHTKSRSVFFRLGRQKITWGDGRLISESDWSARARSLDAARFGFAAGDFDAEALAALLELPSYIPPIAPSAGEGTSAEPVSAGTGAELFGLNAVWHVVPLFHAELTALARVVRLPDASADGPLHPTTLHGWLAPGDTFVLDARVSGEQRGFRYSAEGAYELGRLASYGGSRDLRAFAAAARASLETRLPAHLTFSVQGAYASGDSGSVDPQATQQRFDPIAPEEHTLHGRMGLYAWSNLIEAGAGLSARPGDKLWLEGAYRFVGLASPKGRWTSAALLPIGASATNESHILGHEADVTARFVPWDPLTLEAGYGLFILGDGAKNILDAVGRGRPDMQHFGYVQATIAAP